MARGRYDDRVSGLFYHEVLTALHEAGARFVVVGGLAVNLQGVPRPTADIDLVIELSPDNVRAVAEALRSVGLRPRLPAPPEGLADPRVREQWVRERNLTAYTLCDPDNPLRSVDILVDSPLSFDELSASADRIEARGIRFDVASIEALIRMKEHAGRRRDLADVAALRTLLEEAP